MPDIKLIATDLDGTLLTGDKRLPPDFYAVLHALHRRGILFVAGSGRTYRTLQSTFAQVPDNVHFLCDNGAYVVENGVNTFTSIIAPALWRRAAAAADAEGPQVRALLCGVHGTYLHEYRDAPLLRDQLTSCFAEVTVCPDFAKVQDDIFKIAVCDMRGAGTHAYPRLRAAFGGELNVLHTGPFYLDMMNLGITKGSALAHLQRERGILPEETMAFGDFFNDVDMLACARYSFVMENAAPEMFAHGRFRAPSNECYGVSTIIRRHVLEGQPFP
ncbi:MAG: Cof-type HAD-IIB family hydrolase [Ruthenibacterium sp.]